jgi:NADP-dependent 3-hydroxy acid dehydrogenase YdfG
MARTAVVTGASSGIGAATARALAAQGWDVVIGARRLDRLEALADEIGATAYELDVTDPASVKAFAERVDAVDLLVNNAGGALGAASIAESDDDEWVSMYESNVLGTLRMIRALLPAVIRSGDGVIVNIGSIAAREPYRGGGGYNARAAVRDARETGAGDRDRPGSGRDGVLRRPVRRRRATSRQGVRGDDAAER